MLGVGGSRDSLKVHVSLNVLQNNELGYTFFIYMYIYYIHKRVTFCEPIQRIQFEGYRLVSLILTPIYVINT